jgi:hypothetical protein
MGRPRARKRPETTQVSVVLTVATQRIIKELAAGEGISMGAWIRRITIRELLADRILPSTL